MYSIRFSVAEGFSAGGFSARANLKIIRGEKRTYGFAAANPKCGFSREWREETRKNTCGKTEAER